MLHSRRGLPVLFQELVHVRTTDLLALPEPSRSPTLTVELYEKWYGLQLVTGRRVEEISYEALEDLGVEPAFVDHVPNPDAVIALCERRGWQLNPLALELMVGRWQLEVKEDAFVCPT